MPLFLRLGGLSLIGCWLLVFLAQPVRAQTPPTFDRALRVLAPATGQGSGRPYAEDVVVDAAGNSYVSGYFTGTITLGTNTLTSAGSQDFFVARLAAASTWSWALRGGQRRALEYGGYHAQHQREPSGHLLSDGYLRGSVYSNCPASTRGERANHRGPRPAVP